MQTTYLARRWRNTFNHTWPGFRWPTLVVNGIGLGAAIMSSITLGGTEFAIGELKSWIFFTLAWIGAANLVYLIWNWLMAPGRLAEEDKKEIQALRGQLETAASEEKKKTLHHLIDLKLQTAKKLAEHVEFAMKYEFGAMADEAQKEYIARKEFILSSAMQLIAEEALSDDLRHAVHLADCIMADKISNEASLDDRDKLHLMMKTLVPRLHGIG